MVVGVHFQPFSSAFFFFFFFFYIWLLLHFEAILCLFRHSFSHHSPQTLAPPSLHPPTHALSFSRRRRSLTKNHSLHNDSLTHSLAQEDFTRSANTTTVLVHAAPQAHSPTHILHSLAAWVRRTEPCSSSFWFHSP